MAFSTTPDISNANKAMFQDVPAKHGLIAKWPFRVAVLLLGASLLGVALGMRFTIYHRFVQSTTQCFNGTDVLFNKHAVDFCAFRTSAEGGTECGQPAADLFCVDKGFVWAFNWQQDQAIANVTTVTLGNSMNGGSQVFSEICCDDTSYWPTPPRWILWASGVLLLYPASVFVTNLFLLLVEVILVGLVATEALYFFNGVERVLNQVTYHIGLVVWTYQCFFVIWCNSRECDNRWMGKPLTLYKVGKCLMAFHIGRLGTLLLGKTFGWAYFFKNQLPQLRRVVKQEKKLQCLTAPEWAEALISSPQDSRTDDGFPRWQVSDQPFTVNPGAAATQTVQGAPTNDFFVNFQGGKVINFLSHDTGLAKILPAASRRWLDRLSGLDLPRFTEQQQQQQQKQQHSKHISPFPQHAANPAAAAPAPAPTHARSALLRGTTPSDSTSHQIKAVSQGLPHSLTSRPSAPGVVANVSVPPGQQQSNPAKPEHSFSMPVYQGVRLGNGSIARFTYSREPGFLEEAMIATKQYEQQEEKIAAKQEAHELHTDLIAFRAGVGALKSFRNFLARYQNMKDSQMDAEVDNLASRLYQNLKNGLMRVSKEVPVSNKQPWFSKSILDAGSKNSRDEDEDCIHLEDFVYAVENASKKISGVPIKRPAFLAETAKEAWQMFDKQDAKKLKLDDVRLTLQEIYKQRRNFALSIRANEAVSRSLQSVIGLIIQVAMIFVYLSVFGITYAFTMGLDYFKIYVIVVSYMFRNHFQTMFNNIVYLLGEHPFDVGDELEFQKDGKWIVESFDLNYTLLIGKNGEYSIFPNIYIAQNHPVNWTRTKRRREKFKIRVPPDMPTDVVSKVHEAMTQLYNKKFKDECAPGGGIKVRISDMPDSQTLILTSKFRFSNPPPDDKRCKKIKKAMKEAVMGALLKENVQGIPLNLDWGLNQLKNGKQD